jgi:hypothetical protein
MLRIPPPIAATTTSSYDWKGGLPGPGLLSCEGLRKSPGEGQALELNLADVSFLDIDAVTLLKEVRARGVELFDCSPFVAAQLKAAE